MTTIVKTKYGTPTALTCTSLFNLAATTTTGTGAASAAVDNTADRFTRIRLVGAFCCTSGTLANDKTIYVFLTPIHNDVNGAYQIVSQGGVPGGADAAVSGVPEALLIPLRAVPIAATLQVVKFSALLILPAHKWQAFVRNTTGAALTGDAATWTVSTAYAVGAIVTPTTANGHYYLCTTAGTTSSYEPTWPTTGGTVLDGTAVWKDVGTMLPNTLYYCGEYDEIETTD